MLVFNKIHAALVTLIITWTCKSNILNLVYIKMDKQEVSNNVNSNDWLLSASYVIKLLLGIECAM